MTTELHIIDMLAKQIADLPVPMHNAVLSYVKLIKETSRSNGQDGDFAAIEEQIATATIELALKVLGGLIEERDDGAPTLMRDGKCWHRIRPSKGQVTCQLGTVEYLRSLYRRRGEKTSICPVDESLGLLEGSMTRPAGKIVAYMVSQCPPREVKKILDRLGTLSPSVSSMQRLMGSLHRDWEDIETEALDDIRAQETVPEEAASVSVSLDGVMVLMRPERDKDGKQITEGRNWREASCATVSFLDKDGERLKTISHARMPQGGMDDLKTLLSRDALAVTKTRPDLTLVAVADGAHGFWSSSLHCSS